MAFRSILVAYDKFNGYVTQHGDTRTANWLMVPSIWPTLMISLLYVYLVKRLGPRLMENRKPFKLKNVLLVYNLFQVLSSFYLFYETACIWRNYSLRCEPIDFSTTPQTMRILKTAWLFYMSKFVELLDTIFFVMRKKNEQVSNLHVFHHSIVPIYCWIGIKFFGGGHGTFCVLINTFVHFVMYTYYFLAALGPKMQKYLWWKKHLTVMQMLQFVLVGLHGSQLFFIDCDYPIGAAYLTLFQTTVFLLMFNNFFNTKYGEKAKTVKEKNGCIVQRLGNDLIKSS